MMTEQIDRGKTDALHLLHQFRQLGAEARGLGFVSMVTANVPRELFVLSQSNRIERATEYFMTVTNQLLSSGQPLTMLEGD